MARCEHPLYPIIYVRGFAGTQGEVEDTVADPYMGFNIGSTKVRQRWSGDVDKLFFESPLIRLMKDYDYRDVYEHGQIRQLHPDSDPRVVVIFRYYEDASADFGDGNPKDIEHYAAGLSQLILDLRNQLCDGLDEEDAFRVYLVAHSMGGLVCRCLLQNGEVGSDEARACVDKVYTYATPHNGIQLGDWRLPKIAYRNLSNFNHKRMREYLDIADGEPVNSLHDRFPANRFFCLVGTNHRDYFAPKYAVGESSDGLVKIRNAVVRGSPRAFVHRSHSGHYGIVNSEGGYQNMGRFLFGNVRVTGRLHVHEITLPPKVQQAKDAGRTIRASYHVEVAVRVRGARYDLHERSVDHQCAIFRQYDELTGNNGVTRRDPVIFSQFLAKKWITRGRGLVFAVELGVCVPEYEIDRRLFFDDHVEGAYLYRDTVIVKASRDSNEYWKLSYGYGSSTPGRPGTREADRISDEPLEFSIPIESSTRPGITAELIVTAEGWNEGPRDE